MEECNLFAVLDLPQGSFIGTGVKTVVLFFEKGKQTENIWYFQLDVGRSMGKTNPLNERDLADFVEMAITKQISENSWLVDKGELNTKTWALTVQNPNKVEEQDNRTPQDIIAEIEQLDNEAAIVLKGIKELL